jgi:biofilm protein TabA
MKKSPFPMDRLEKAGKYCKMHPAFEEVFAFLKRKDLADLPLGRHEIEGDRVFCLISKGSGKSREAARLEIHSKYIDIQYIISGTDEMGWKAFSDCIVPDGDFDVGKDIGFFKDEPEVWVKVQKGSFVIFFPQDAHAPLTGKGEIHKAVVKIAV